MNLTPEIVLQAYACGVFPMSESADDPNVFWVEPEQRGVLPLNEFHVPRRLARTLRQNEFQITINHCFGEVMQHCAEPQPDRDSTWINDTILELYRALHQRGNAHSVEVWQGTDLIGGLYGVSLGRAFFGESMFSRRRDTSKIALCHLVGRLIMNEFVLLDSQFITDHLGQFGAKEISRADYLAQLKTALEGGSAFDDHPAPLTGTELMDLILSARLDQTS